MVSNYVCLPRFLVVVSAGIKYLMERTIVEPLLAVVAVAVVVEATGLSEIVVHFCRTPEVFA